MGLNLNISRVIFSSLEKFDGDRRRNLTTGEIKQIAGRAGRYKVSEGFEGTGWWWVVVGIVVVVVHMRKEEDRGLLSFLL